MLVFPVLRFFSVCLVSTLGGPVLFLSISIIISLECQSPGITAFPHPVIYHCHLLAIFSLMS